jgi:hypothetical protein
VRFNTGNGWYYYGTQLSGTNTGTWALNDVIGVALDMTNNIISIYQNNTLLTTLSGYIDLTVPHTLMVDPYYTGTSVALNCGQQGFKYTPPSGYKALCTTNLPTPTIGATVATAANKYFDATTYTGNGTGLGSTQTITNGGFQPDFIWIKSRSTADYHNLNDTVRGIVGTGSPTLITNTTDAEQTFTGYGVSAVNSNGFNLIGNGSYTNASGTTYVGWQWNAGGSTVTNTSGSIS